MNNLNTVLVEGTLTKNPESKVLSAGTNYCRLAIANNRYYADRNGEWKQDTSFFAVAVYGSVAELCVKYLRKGRGIRVVGRLKQYLRVVEGVRREGVYIIAEHIEFQPERKSIKNVPTEPERMPGEIVTTANTDGLIPEVKIDIENEEETFEESQEVEEEATTPEF